MASTFEAAWPSALQHEGSKFTNIVGDPGGATKFGITLHNAQLHNLDIDHDGDTDIDDIKNMTEDEAKVYYHQFWWRPLYEAITDQKVATKLFDTTINVGEFKAYTWLQQACNVLTIVAPKRIATDGSFGPATLAAVNSVLPDSLLKVYRNLQSDFYTRWVDAKLDERQKFLAGLLNRARF